MSRTVSAPPAGGASERQAGGGPSGGASRRSVFIVAALVVLGLAGGAVIYANARSSSPIYTASNLYAHGPVTRSTAARSLLDLRPGSVQGTNMADTVGIPLRRAMLEATGHPTGRGAFPGRISVVPDPSRGGFLIRVTMPVAVGRLERTGSIRLGVLPGSSNLKTGRLSVTVKAGRLYGIQMNPHTHQAVFVFDLARSDENVASLNWNANSVLQQTDGSDPFS